MLISTIKIAANQNSQFTQSFRTKNTSVSDFDTHQIFTIKPLLANKFKNKSIGLLKKRSSIDECYLNNRLKLTSPRRNSIYSIPKYKEFSISENFKDKLKKRTISQSPLIRQREQGSSIHLKNQKKIIQKILKLTHQLEIANPYYINFIKTHRPQQKQQQSRQRYKQLYKLNKNFSKRLYTVQNQRNSYFNDSYNYLTFYQRTNNNTYDKLYGTHKNNEKQCKNFLQASITKSKINQRHRYKKKLINIYKSDSYKLKFNSEECDELNQDIRKSIRGWTRCTKRYEDIDH